MNDLSELLDYYWRKLKNDASYIKNEFVSAADRAKYVVGAGKRQYQYTQDLLKQAAGLNPNDPLPKPSLDELYRGPGKAWKLLNELAK